MHRRGARERLGHRAHAHLPAQHHRVHPAARAGRARRPRRPCAAPVRARLPQPRQGPQGRRADDGRQRYGLCGHAVRRMACARARDLRQRSRLQPGRGAAGRDPDQRGLPRRWRAAGLSRTRPLRRFHRARRLAARQHFDPARQEPDPCRAPGRQAHGAARARLRSARGHRPGPGQLDRRLHARRVSPSCAATSRCAGQRSSPTLSTGPW